MSLAATRRLPKLLAAPAIAAAILASLAHAQQLPPGWRLQPGRDTGESRTFEATGLPTGEYITVRQGPRQPRNGKSLEELMLAAASADLPAEGTWVNQPVKLQAQQSFVLGWREFKTADGVHGLAFYAAAGGEGDQARILRTLFRSVALTRTQQGQAARKLMVDMAVQESRQGRSAQADDTTSTAPTKSTPAKPAAYAYVTAPGAGLPQSEIEIVYYHWDQRYDAFQGLQMEEEAYLLLKDGTAYDGLPVPPQDMDLAASRRNEPAKWGRWRRQGDAYAFAWPNAPNAFRVPRGNPVPPTKPGTKLHGQFEGASSYVLPGGGVTTWSETGVTFTPDGRFTISRSGGAGVSGGTTNTASMTIYDNDQVTSTTVSPSIAIGTQARKPNTGSRTGTYQTDGYLLQLNYDNGLVERRAFFVDGDGVWMFGTRLHRKKK